MSGFDFFLKREKNLEPEFDKFKSTLGKELPLEIKKYFSNFEPIDIYENEIMEQVVTDKIQSMELSVHFVSEKKEVPIESFYTIQEVLNQINILADQYAQLGVFPIIKSLGRTEVVVSLNDDMYGKIFYVNDWGYSDVSSDELCAENIFDFIEQVKIVSLDEWA